MFSRVLPPAGVGAPRGILPHPPSVASGTQERPHGTRGPAGAAGGGGATDAARCEASSGAFLFRYGDKACLGL